MNKLAQKQRDHLFQAAKTLELLLENVKLRKDQYHHPSSVPMTSTVHKVQGLRLEKGVIDFDLRKQRSFGPGQIQTDLCRVKMYDNLYCMGKNLQ